MLPIACIGLALLGACEANKQKETIVENQDLENVTVEDTGLFAHGIQTEEETKESETEEKMSVENLTDEIDETCPNAVSTPRADVAYGEFTHGTYFSETCGLERGYCILLPADYSKEKKYPVMYLLHGIFGNEYSFSEDPNNRIKEIVGNMAADGLIEETIVVCPNMYATTDPNQQPGFDAEACLPYDNFINDLVNDLMPYIESEYSVLTGRENTYLAGFSMGGRETIYITLRYAHMLPSEQADMANQLDEEMAQNEMEEKRNVS